MTEKQAYEVVRNLPEFELRRYAPHVLAEVVVRASFEEAGNAAFRTLLGYISGQNQAATKVAMTAPVLQRDSRSMLAPEPVDQARTGEGEYVVAFVLPSSFTLANAPVPTRPEVQLRERPTTLAAARRYRGRWNESSFEAHRRILDRAVRTAGLVPTGSPRWARFDPPFVPSLLRRNEVVQDVLDTSSSVTSAQE